MHLDFSAISDVGRVRKENQDSGYAGPWVLAVCDGVGGAARGDIASATTVAQLRRLDVPPPEGHDEEKLLGEVAGALHRAHDRIAELVEEDPALSGTSTTATVARFDGDRLAIGHLGDSRAYLYREDGLTQLTHDHTFVQSLVDEGRISDEEARVHPHRNLILKALDGVHDVDPDLFMIQLQAGDRILLCSDGACGVLDDGRLADILSGGTTDYAAVELVRASLEAGSSDNVTCLVADVVADQTGTTEDGTARTPATLEPLLVGAAAELPRRATRGRGAGLFRGHRSGDTGELEPIDAEIPEEVDGWAIHSDPIDPETARYAPRAPARFRWLKQLLGLLVIAGLVWVVAAGAWWWSQQQYYVGEQEGTVVIFRGVDADVPGLQLSRPYQTTNVELERLSDFTAGRVRSGIAADDLDDAQSTVDNLAAEMEPAAADAQGAAGGDTGDGEGTR